MVLAVDVDRHPEPDPVVDEDRQRDRVSDAAVAGRIGRHRVVAVGRVSPSEVDGVVHPRRVEAGLAAVEAEVAADRRRRRRPGRDVDRVLGLAVVGEHHHLPRDVDLHVLAGARVLEVEAAAAVGELLEDPGVGVEGAIHPVGLAEGHHREAGPVAVALAVGRE